MKRLIRITIGGLTAFLRGIGVLLYIFGLARMVVSIRRRVPRVVIYHSCAPVEDAFTLGLQSNVDPEQFAMHLRVYRSLYVPTTTTAIESGEFPDCSLAITFDDGYRSVIEHAVPVMRRHGFVGTIYLATSAIGNRALLWPNELCWFLSRHRESTLAAIARCASGLSRDASAFDAVNFLCAHASHSSVMEMLSSLRSIHGVNAESLASGASLYLTWAQVESLRAEGFEFGNHTHTHPDCSKLTRDELESELMTSESILRNHALHKRSFAYPFGANSHSDRQMLGDFGFKSVMVLEEIGNAPINLHRISRIGSDAKTAALLFADLELVSPFRSAVRRFLGVFG